MWRGRAGRGELRYNGPAGWRPRGGAGMDANGEQKVSEEKVTEEKGSLTEAERNALMEHHMKRWEKRAQIIMAVMAAFVLYTAWFMMHS